MKQIIRRKRPKRYKIKKIRGGGNKVSRLYVNKRNRLMLGEVLKSLLLTMTEIFLIKYSELKNSKKKDNKIMLITLKFSMSEYEKIKNEHRLRPTTQDLLHLMYEFGKLHKVKDTIKVHLVDDQLQKIETDTCGIFQIYFYFNLCRLKIVR